MTKSLDNQTTKAIRWAILGPGKIAHKFAAGFPDVNNAKLHAVASRDIRRAKEFALSFDVGVVYDRYDDLVKDPSVDAIYISTPHPFHFEQTLLCLRHGKAVLCEKPLTINYLNALEMVRVAREANTFLMEGMWSRFFPSVIKTLELARQGAIGELKYVRADFGFAAPHDPGNRVLNLALGGGAQLDVGVYPLSLALMLMGRPDKIQATGRLAETGADESSSVQLTFKNGSIAQIFSSIVADTPKQADIIGTTGSITLQTPWHKSQRVTLRSNSGEENVFDYPFSGFGFQYEIQEVTDRLLQGKKQSSAMSLDFSLMLAETADEILKQIDVVYPAI